MILQYGNLTLICLYVSTVVIKLLDGFVNNDTDYAVVEGRVNARLFRLLSICRLAGNTQ